jgi:hypothetical protein
MQYSCKDIRRILNSESDDLICEQSFTVHLEQCGECRSLYDLEPELERLLRTSLPKAVSIPLSDKVMAEIRSDENNLISNRLIDRYLPVGAASLLVIVTAIIVARWNEFAAAIASIKPGSAIEGVVSLVQSIGLPQTNLSELMSHVINSPAVILGLIAATALLWAYSILEFEKSPG